MESPNTQVLFFHHIKSRLAPHVSLVDEVAELLGISIDSAYRRIRAEKTISFEELQKLCSHFKISLDQFLHLKSDSFIFTGRIANSSDFTFENWLQTVAQHLQLILNQQPNHLFYLAKEIPFFYYFLIPEIAAFKSFFFMKSILYYEDWKTTKFSVKNDYSQYHEIWNKISNSFASIPSTEIWSIENITSTIHQIEFYRVTGALGSDEDAVCLLDKLLELIDHIEMQAEYGVKLRYRQKPSTSNTVYKMFSNELIMGDNMQLVQMGNTQLTYINHSVINFIVTHDVAFNTYMKKTMDVIAQKSTPISEVNEKDRILFFNRIRAKLKNARQQIFPTPYTQNA
jgi:transcriptional regulator with XRE-family HTH domain